MKLFWPSVQVIGNRHVAAASLLVGGAYNLPTAYFRHIQGKPTSDILWEYLVYEIAIFVFISWSLFLFFRLLGKKAETLLGCLLILISAVCAYFMSVHKVIIGYGVVSAVLTTDHDMSFELLNFNFFAWLIFAALVPAVVYWRWLWQATSVFGQGKKSALVSVSVMAAQISMFVFLATCAVYLVNADSKKNRTETEERKNTAGIVAHSYVPLNWIAGTAMLAHAHWTERNRSRELIDPSREFAYTATVEEEMHVVLVIGESARYDRMSVFGHSRKSTPQLQEQSNVVAFPGLSCDTSTKLSLACMFVRQESIKYGKNGAPDTYTEDNVFSVLKKIGFQIDLFALQSELGFYAKTYAENYKFREVIAAQPDNLNRPIHDAILLPELRKSIHDSKKTSRHRLTILHTKGSHYNYANRYPREYARFVPECLDSNSKCSKDEMLNAYDNSILYTDHVLTQIMRELKNKRSLLIYTSDHGETIEEGQHFHASPRHVAPVEQRKVPLVFWASNQWLEHPVLKKRWHAMKRRAKEAHEMQYGHANIFPSMLSCLGIDSEKGITASLNLCHIQ